MRCAAQTGVLNLQKFGDYIIDPALVGLKTLAVETIAVAIGVLGLVINYSQLYRTLAACQWEQTPSVSRPIHT